MARAKKTAVATTTVTSTAPKTRGIDLQEVEARVTALDKAKRRSYDIFEIEQRVYNLENNGSTPGPEPTPGPTIKKYCKFLGGGIYIPKFTLNANHQIFAKFHQVSYVNAESIIGNSDGKNLLHLTSYANDFYTSSGSNEVDTGVSASNGEHTFVCNNAENKNLIDGNVVCSYTPPAVNNVLYSIGKRPGATDIQTNIYIMEFEIYDKSNDVVLMKLVPATLNGFDCLYDQVSGITIVSNMECFDEV